MPDRIVYGPDAHADDFEICIIPNCRRVPFALQGHAG